MASDLLGRVGRGLLARVGERQVAHAQRQGSAGDRAAGLAHAGDAAAEVLGLGDQRPGLVQPEQGEDDHGLPAVDVSGAGAWKRARASALASRLADETRALTFGLVSNPPRGR